MWQETVVCLLNLGVCTDKFATLGSESLLLLINLKKKKNNKATVSMVEKSTGDNKESSHQRDS